MDLLFDFDNPSDAQRSLKRISQAMLRAGQPVAQTSFDARVQRRAGISFRQALLTLASGQTVALQVKQTGDIFRVLLNKRDLPIKNQNGLEAVAEIAAAARANEKRFQAVLARQRAELPKSVRTAAPRLQQALAERVTYLDQRILEARTTRDNLRTELGIALDGAGADEAPMLVLDAVNDQQADAVLARLDAGEVLDSAELESARTVLGIALHGVETNAPIWRAEGEEEQAELCERNAESFRAALAKLGEEIEHSA